MTRRSFAVNIGHDIHTHSCKCQSGFQHTDERSDGILACLEAGMKTNKMKLSVITDNDLHLWQAPLQKSVALHHLHDLNYVALLIAEHFCQCARCEVSPVSNCNGKENLHFFFSSTNWEHVEVTLIDSFITGGKSRDLSCKNSLRRQRRTAQGLWETTSFKL